MNTEKVAEYIVSWLKDYAVKAKVDGFVVGVSGGIDSAVTSTLCSKTGLTTVLVSMPIHQEVGQDTRSRGHMGWLLGGDNKKVEAKAVDLTAVYDLFADHEMKGDNKLALANTASRIRAVKLYQFANARNLLVVGTGNKVEDHGVRFFTKYGDGAVDISPIADLTKTQVRELGRYLGVAEEILNAVPTDGLWEDNRSDEDQIGASYEELEWAMSLYDSQGLCMDGNPDAFAPMYKRGEITERQLEVLRVFASRHEQHAHKMEMPPACEIPTELKE